MQQLRNHIRGTSDRHFTFRFPFLTSTLLILRFHTALSSKWTIGFSTQCASHLKWNLIADHAKTALSILIFNRRLRRWINCTDHFVGMFFIIHAYPRILSFSVYLPIDLNSFLTCHYGLILIITDWNKIKIFIFKINWVTLTKHKKITLKPKLTLIEWNMY